MDTSFRSQALNPARTARGRELVLSLANGPRQLGPGGISDLFISTGPQTRLGARPWRYTPVLVRGPDPDFAYVSLP